MKRLLFCFILLTFWSCSVNDVDNDYYYEFLPIESVVMPEYFTMGFVYTIEYSYYRPSTCHAFHDLYYNSENNVRSIAIINSVSTINSDGPCTMLSDELIERSFNFKATSNGSYVFKFWQGEDENGEDQFLIYEIPVEE